METLKINSLPTESAWHLFLRFILRPLMIFIGNPKKITYWWNWINTEFKPVNTLIIKCPWLKKNNIIKIGLGRCKRSISIEPKNRNQKNWRLGFISTDKNQFCSIINNGPVNLQIGPEEIRFYGLDEKNNEIELTTAKYNYHYQIL